MTRMVDEPDNAVLRLLREIRGTPLAHGGQLEKLVTDNETFKFQLTHALGIAAMANLTSQHAEARVDLIEARQKELKAEFKRLEEEVRGH